jgi:hypothetical protein
MWPQTIDLALIRERQEEIQRVVQESRRARAAQPPERLPGVCGAARRAMLRQMQRAWNNALLTLRPCAGRSTPRPTVDR